MKHLIENKSHLIITVHHSLQLFCQMFVFSVICMLTLIIQYIKHLYKYHFHHTTVFETVIILKIDQNISHCLCIQVLHIWMNFLIDHDIFDSIHFIINDLSKLNSRNVFLKIFSNKIIDHFLRKIHIRLLCHRNLPHSILIWRHFDHFIDIWN